MKCVCVCMRVGDGGGSKSDFSSHQRNVIKL